MIYWKYIPPNLKKFLEIVTSNLTWQNHDKIHLKVDIRHFLYYFTLISQIAAHIEQKVIFNVI